MNRCIIAYIALIIYSSLQYGVVARPPLQIINGTTAEDGEFPYMVQVVIRPDDFHCGGSILSPEWILTAAHCVEDWYYYQIVYGTNKLYGYNHSYPNTTILANQTFQHPKFTHSSQGVPIYDVGLIQLAEPIPFSDYAQPIQLAEENEDVPVHVDGVLSGWGCLGLYEPSPEYLQKINLQFLTDEECVKIINGYVKDDEFIPVHHLCTNDNLNGECYGDSGSPFVINGTQYGLSSWSVYPGVISGAYSRLTNPEYRGWIKSVTGI